jgi:cytohesin
MDVRIRVLAVVALVLALQTAGCGRREKPDDMFMAIQRNDVTALKELLAKGEDPNAVRAGRGTPLSMAVSSGKAAVARALLEGGADPNGQVGSTPVLHFAVMRGREELIRALIDHGADVNVPDSRGLSPLASAIWKNKVKAADLLRSYGAEESWGEEAGAALTLAVRVADTERVKSLLASGVDPNERLGSGYPPLHVALMRRKPEVVKVLLAGGADPNALMEEGTPLFVAVREARGEYVVLLVAHGADVNARPKGRGTPLMLARATGQMRMAAMLKAHGARAPWGEMRGGAIFDAIERGDSAGLAGLLEEGADPNLPGPEGMIAIHLAVLTGKPGAIRLLLQHGADPDVPCRTGLKPLHVAAMQGNLEAAELLLARGANVNANDRAGRTPLVYAVAVGNEEMARLLQERGGRDYVPLDRISDWDWPEVDSGEGAGTDTRVDPFGSS